MLEKVYSDFISLDPVEDSQMRLCCVHFLNKILCLINSSIEAATACGKNCLKGTLDEGCKQAPNSADVGKIDCAKLCYWSEK